MKLVIDIPDNELKDPLKNIHLFISNGNITEVCIKTYDKDNKPYYMNLNYSFFEECDDVISREETLTAFADYVGSGMSMDDYDALWNIVAKMPSVTPADEICCNCTDEEIAKSFIEDVEVIKDLLPKTDEKCQNCKKDWTKCTRCPVMMKWVKEYKKESEARNE